MHRQKRAVTDHRSSCFDMVYQPLTTLILACCCHALTLSFLITPLAKYWRHTDVLLLTADTIHLNKHPCFCYKARSAPKLISKRSVHREQFIKCSPWCKNVIKCKVAWLRQCLPSNLIAYLLSLQENQRWSKLLSGTVRCYSKRCQCSSGAPELT